MRRLISIITSTLICTQLSAQLKLVLPVGHTSQVSYAEFSPDGKKVVTASYDGTAKIWDANTGYLLADLKEHTAAVNYAQFSPDGKKILTASRDSTAKIWDAATGEPLLNLNKHRGRINTAEFSPDGKKVVTASNDGSAKIWDAESGLLLTSLDKHRSRFINTAHFSPDGKKIVTASGDETAKIWNAGTGKLLQNLNEHTGDVVSAEFSRDGKKIVTASRDSTAKIWDANTGRLLENLAPQPGTVTLAHFSPDGEKIITASDDTAKIWDVNTGRLLKNLDKHGNSVSSAEFSPDGKKIITASYDGTAKIWDANTGYLLSDLKEGMKGTPAALNFVQFDSAGKRIVTAALDGTAKIWNVISGRPLVDLTGNANDIRNSKFSKSGNFIYTTGYDNRSKPYRSTWDAATGKLLNKLKIVSSKKWIVDLDNNHETIEFPYTENKPEINIADTTNALIVLQTHHEYFRKAKFSRDEKIIITSSLSYAVKTRKKIYTIKTWDPTSGKMLQSFAGQRTEVRHIEFSPDGKNMVTTSQDYSANIWNLATGKLLKKLSGHTDDIERVEFSPDGKKIVTASQDSTARIWDAVTGRLLKILDKHHGTVNAAHFNKDGKKILTASDDKIARIWDVSSGAQLAKLSGHRSRVYDALFSPDEKKIITHSGDYTAKVWNAETGELVYTFFEIGNADYLVQLPTGYYSSSSGAAKQLHYVTNDLKVVGFEQLDIKYNRPDKVLVALGNKDTLLIQSYRNAYHNRIMRLGIDTSSFQEGYSVPECDLVNREQLEPGIGQQEKEIPLHIRGTDSTYKLDRYNVWVNEVPIFGIKGISLLDKNKQSFDTTVTITLSQGENRIETSVFNVNATESFRKPLFINYSPPEPQKSTVYFIGIGVNQYKNDTTRNLSFATKDIRDLDSLFRKNNTTVVSKIFIDSSSTKENILSVKKMLMNTGINDKVIIALSGHGVLHEQKDFYFGTYDIDFNKPNERGLKYEDLESLLDDIPARKKLLLIDACHSGEVDTSLKSIAFETKETDSLPSNIKTKGDPNRRSKNAIGLDNSFELMKELFTDLSRSNGAVVISAARGLGYAEEDRSWNNGAFTLCLKAAFLGNDKFPELKETADKNRDGVSINELKEYILIKVPLLTKDRQKPTTRRENIEVDWKLW